MSPADQHQLQQQPAQLQLQDGAGAGAAGAGGGYKSFELAQQQYEAAPPPKQFPGSAGLYYHHQQTSPIAPPRRLASLAPTREHAVRKAAPFLRCLLEMIKNESPSVISWDSSPTAKVQLLVSQPAILVREVFPKYFGHSRYSSFKRQLNYFNFSKLPPVKDKPDACRYRHDDLAGSPPEDILRLVRKRSDKASASRAAMQQQQQHEDHMHMLAAEQTMKRKLLQQQDNSLSKMRRQVEQQALAVPRGWMFNQPPAFYGSEAGGGNSAKTLAQIVLQAQEEAGLNIGIPQGGSMVPPNYSTGIGGGFAGGAFTQEAPQHRSRQAAWTTSDIGTGGGNFTSPALGVNSLSAADGNAEGGSFKLDSAGGNYTGAAAPRELGKGGRPAGPGEMTAPQPDMFWDVPPQAWSTGMLLP